LTHKNDAPPDEFLLETIEVSRSRGRMPQRIGHYTIQSVIASGGMGTVFKAVQESPHRTVALKVMKAGVNSAAELRRFEFEAQLLGRLRHPGIAQIYEAGTHCEEGSSVPFFAMEYIPNAKNIIHYAQDKNLGTRERLELFAQVCEAVHHGHQKGIIHRDLKPGNILIGSSGEPRVIDFGVARATDSDMALTQHQTDVGQLVGTVQYMSPEQCEADPLDIDTRSDVYSLGIVLYELLCGRLPYDLHQVPVFEATRVIRNQVPPRPGKVNPKLRGDLETIMLKALEKDRDRRYQSAAELDQDVRRYLGGNAITAHPASSIYQLRVFARRNKGFLAAASVVVVVLVAGVIVSSTLYFRSRNYQIQTYALEAKAQGAQDYLQDVIDSIGDLWGDRVPVSRLLKTFGDNIQKRFADQPEVEAEVRYKLAQKYDFLSMFKGGLEAREFAAMAKEHFSEALRLQRELYGEGDPRTLLMIEETAYHHGIGFDLDRAEAMRREALKIREGSKDPDINGIMGARRDLAEVLADKGRLKEAEALNKEALEHFRTQLGGDDPETRSALSLQAWIRQLQGRSEEALSDRLELLETARRVSGSGTEEETVAQTDLANAYVSLGRFDKAGSLYQKTLPLSLERLGIKKWLIKDYALQAKAPTLLFFWESWCPYCQLALSKLEGLLTEDGSPLQVIGMTSLNGGMNEDDAKSFIERNHLDFPNAVYAGKIFDELGLTGYPTAVALHEGNIVWKGHPEGISKVFLEGLAGGRLQEF
jgi:tRNA A-37 threonylcarbamoyl transferase component Bud32/thiol-disulfide isomerase/thioredoxin